MRKRNWFALIALLGALTLVAAACADEEEGGEETGATGTTAVAVDCDADPFGCVEVGAGEPITIGTLLAISGDVAFLGLDSQHGAELAIAEEDRISLAEAPGGADGRRFLARARQVEAEPSLALE